MKSAHRGDLLAADAVSIPYAYTHQYPHRTAVQRTVGNYIADAVPRAPVTSRGRNQTPQSRARSTSRGRARHTYADPTSSSMLRSSSVGPDTSQTRAGSAHRGRSSSRQRRPTSTTRTPRRRDDDDGRDDAKATRSHQYPAHPPTGRGAARVATTGVPDVVRSLEERNRALEMQVQELRRELSHMRTQRVDHQPPPLQPTPAASAWSHPPWSRRAAAGESGARPVNISGTSNGSGLLEPPYASTIVAAASNAVSDANTSHDTTGLIGRGYVRTAPLRQAYHHGQPSQPPLPLATATPSTATMTMPWAPRSHVQEQFSTSPSKLQLQRDTPAETSHGTNGSGQRMRSASKRKKSVSASQVIITTPRRAHFSPRQTQQLPSPRSQVPIHRESDLPRRVAGKTGARMPTSSSSPPQMDPTTVVTQQQPQHHRGRADEFRMQQQAYWQKSRAMLSELERTILNSL